MSGHGMQRRVERYQRVERPLDWAAQIIWSFAFVVAVAIAALLAVVTAWVWLM